MESGTFSSQPGVEFRLRHFVATLERMGDKAPECFQKVTVVSRAEIFVSNESLTNVFAAKLGGANSKIRDFQVENSAGKVTLRGKITKVIPIAFAVEGPVTTDGKVLRVEAQKIKADGLPVKVLLGVIGEHLDAVLAVKGVSGVTVEGNAIVFSPEQVAHLKGHIAAVETTEQGLILRYGGHGMAGRERAVAGR